MTPTADALRGLVGAAKATAEWEGECGSCGEAIPACDKTDQPPDPKFPGCPGPVARAALAAWESRGRLRDDAELHAKVLAKVRRQIQERDIDTRALLDIVEAHLFGPATKETP